MSDIVSFLLFMLALFLVVVGIVAGLIIGTQPMRNYRCQAKWEPYETKSNWSGGCRVGIMHDGQKIFVPEASLRFPRS